MQNDLDPKGLLPRPFCGGPAKEPMLYNGAMETGCAGPHECPGTDVLVPIAAWNRRHLSATVPAGDGELVERLREDAEMLCDGLQLPGLNEAWHNVVMKTAAADCLEAASRLSQGTGVTDEMVERVWIDSQNWPTPVTRNTIRRTLTAALSGDTL